MLPEWPLLWMHNIPVRGLASSVPNSPVYPIHWAPVPRKRLMESREMIQAIWLAEAWSPNSGEMLCADEATIIFTTFYMPKGPFSAHTPQHITELKLIVPVHRQRKKRGLEQGLTEGHNSKLVTDLIIACWFLPHPSPLGLATAAVCIIVRVYYHSTLKLPWHCTDTW